MQKYWVFILIMAMATSACQKRIDEHHARLKGHIPEGAGEWIYLEELQIRERILLDSAKVNKDDNFLFYIDIESPGFYLLKTRDAIPLSLILRPGDDVELQTTLWLRPDSSQTNSPSNEVLRAFQVRKKLDENRIDSLTLGFRQATGREDFLEIKQILDETYDRIFRAHKAWVLERILENDTSILSLFLLNQRLGMELLFPEENYLDLFEHLETRLSGLYPGNLHAEDHKDRVSVLKRRLYDHQLAMERLQPGQAAPQFILPNLEGKRVALDTLKGKPTLLYLWSAECAPCRLQNQEIRGILKNRPDIQFITISLDVHKQVWEGGIRLDQLPGLHLSDLQGPNSPMQQLYLPGRSIPFYYAIDRDGNILSSFNTIEQLKATLPVL